MSRSPQKGKRTRDRLDEQLDQALVATFPASDPVAIGQPTGTEAPVQPVDRQPPVAPSARRRSRGRAKVKQAG
jgi:hypothetical protein